MQSRMIGASGALTVAALCFAGSAQGAFSVSGTVGIESGDDVSLFSDIIAEHSSGFYAGWSAATIGGLDDVENALYAGFAGGSVVSFDLGAVYYWLLSDPDFDGFELYAGLGWGPVSLSATYALDDRFSAGVNAGDVLVGLGVDFNIGLGLVLSLAAEYASFDSSGPVPTTVSSAFTGASVTLSYHIFNTPATIYASYSFGGEDRTGANNDDSIGIGLSYAFDIY